MECSWAGARGGRPEWQRRRCRSAAAACQQPSRIICTLPCFPSCGIRSASLQACRENGSESEAPKEALQKVVRQYGSDGQQELLGRLGAGQGCGAAEQL